MGLWLTAAGKGYTADKRAHYAVVSGPRFRLIAVIEGEQEWIPAPIGHCYTNHK